MSERVKHPSSSLDEIKQQLDPAYSFMIFEKPGESSEETEFQQIFDLLARLDLSVHQCDYFQDEARGVLLLLVGFDPVRADKIVQEFLNVGLPEGISFYAYGSPMADEG